jgi:hypothetical protein
MKMKVSGLENMELAGNITGFRVSRGYLLMNIRLTTPVGWNAEAALTHKDLMTFMKLLLSKPSIISYILFGSRKRTRE